MSLPPGVHDHAFTVPEAAIDGNGHANNLEYLRWMLAAAAAHSDARGWTRERYRDTGTSWVVRSHTIDYLRPTFAGEAINLFTWIAFIERQESLRHYLFWRERDRKILARARTLWVFVDAGTGRSRSIPDQFRSAFEVVPDEKALLQALRG